MMNTTQPIQHNERPHLDTMTAGAWLPLTQATIIAVVTGIGTYAIAWLVFDVMDPHKPAILFAVVTWVIMLVKLQRHWLTRTTGVIERIIERDIDGDGVIGAKPAPRRVVIQMDRVKDDGHYQAGDTSSRIEFPCSDDQLYKLALGLVNGLPFTDRTWAGDGKLFTDQEWREMKAAMFRKYGSGEDAEPLIEYVNPENKKHGIRLTASGKATMEEIANSPTPQ